ncbi:Protein CBG01758 [Caenorhabditis briggsae]|uniref:Protein CBG01758 n=1 Tax=Caenorhabditis briggsae TaxID=6238 RepID=A8WQX0_CAEBR|nr:Protein CBG01758 [Caenorhabditis briggsae]CAP22878.2 Protein CBG01758 [Caenorhabditis briggsae]
MENEDDKLSAEYSCSLHSKNRETAGDEFDAKVEQIYKDLKDSSIERKEDISYKPNGELTQIDIWGPENAQKVFIMIHGGYWMVVVGVAQSLGYTVVSIGYDYANKNHTLRQTIQEAIDGVRFALDRFENAKKVVIGGHSVGAHLAFQAVTRIQDLRISGAFLSAGIYKLHELVNTKYGRDLALTPEEADLCSCDYDLLKTVKFPILIANCKLESPKLFQQNVEFSQLVKNAQYKEYAGEDHFSILTELTNENSVVHNDFYKFLHSI